MRAIYAVTVLFGLMAQSAVAQNYTPQRPAPRTTSAPALQSLATQREIEERFNIGIAALSRGDWKSAAAEFERVVALNPPEPKGSSARYNLAIAYANEGRNQDAARQLRSAIALDNGFLAAMANLISVDLAIGDLREARVIADRYIALDPASARALYSRGIVALSSGDAVTAREDFGKLLHVNASYAVAHYDLALAEERLGRYDAAEQELRSALALSPDYARARFALGVVLLREGEHAAARNAFDLASRDAAGDPALQNIAAAMRDSIHPQK